MQMLLDDLKIKLGLVTFGWEMMIKLVNGIPEKLVEMDEQVTFVEQMNQDTGPVMQINKFNVNPDEVDEFLKAFAATAEVLKRQPGYISAQLHRGIAGSCVFLNYEVWESAEHFKQAVSSSEFQSSIVGLPPNTVMSPHLFKKVAVPGICVD
jgi:heme-degrading monooxygenase HmoA